MSNAAEAIQFKVVRPQEVEPAEWAVMYEMSLEGYTQAYTERSPEQVAAFVGETLEVFRDRRHDPQMQVGSERIRAGQYLSQPSIAIASHEGQPVGFSMATNNISGSPVSKIWKALTVVKNYRKQSEVVVARGYQGDGIGKLLVAHTMATALPLQKATGYLYEEDMPQAWRIASSLGFVFEKPKPVNAFNDPNNRASQTRAVATRSRKRAKQILNGR